MLAGGWLDVLSLLLTWLARHRGHSQQCIKLRILNSIYACFLCLTSTGRQSTRWR